VSENSFSEERIAETLKISRTDLIALRKEILFEREHWETKKRTVIYTQSGLDKVLEHLNLVSQGFAAPLVVTKSHNGVPRESSEPINNPEAISAKEPAPEYVLIRITEKFRNPVLMAAVFEGNPIRVRVRDSKNFMVGMEIKARRIRDDFFIFEGRCPRWKGRF
jgi:hypothetical protein